MARANDFVTRVLMMKSLIVKEMTLSEKLDEVLEQIAAQEEKDKVAEAHISQLVEKLVSILGVL